MKINKVTLTDYRSHIGEHTFEFTEGINLLLGRNGAGKSSILEALGLALFNTGNRSSTNDDAVNFLAKSAIINVEFESIDGIQYVVERKIGASPNIKLYHKGVKTSRLEGIGAVEKKIKELAGIDENSKNIYENVITAYQNKMTGIFSDIESRRQEVFNQIFDTAIYKKLADGLTKKAEDKFDVLKSNNMTLLKDKIDKISDSGKLNSELEESEKIKFFIEKEKDALLNEIFDLEKAASNLKDTKNQIDITTIQIKNKKDSLSKENETITVTQKRLELSQQSLEIVTINENNYKAYKVKSEELKFFENEIDKLEKKEKQKHDLEIKLNLNINDQTKSIQEINNSESNLIEKNQNIENLKNEIINIENDITSENELKRLNDKELSDYSADKETFNKFNENINNQIKQLDQQNLLINDKQKIKYDFEEIENTISKSENEKIELNQFFNLKKDITNKIESLKTRLKDNEEARKKLSTGICPYLKNDCQNLKSGSSAEEFFETRKIELQIELDILNEEIKKYRDLEKHKFENDSKIVLLKKHKEDGLKNISDLNQIQNCIGIITRDLEIAELKLIDLLRKFFEYIPNFFETKDFKLAENFLSEQISNFRGQSKSIITRITGLKENLNQKKNEQSSIELHIVSLKKSIEEKLNLVEKLKTIESDLKNKIEILEEEIKSLPELKMQKSDINKELEIYKEGYDIYNKNINSSKEIPSLINQIENLNLSVSRIIEENEKLQFKLDNLNTEFSEIKLKNVQNILIEKKGIEKEYSSKLTEANLMILRKKDEIEKNRKLITEVKELNLIIKHLENKFNLTKEFRDNLKKMGKLVASRLLAKIEHIATENYRRISGRTEHIEWKNDESNAYTVYLTDGTHFRKFEQLSGGEQVTVAISLRSAMASILTKANFVIFDEPTNNLDSERKSALAESLQDLLKNLKQAIIVTHDNSFEEMAQNIINLDK
jgi:exonuclease SbcC